MTADSNDCAAACVYTATVLPAVNKIARSFVHAHNCNTLTPAVLAYKHVYKHVHVYILCRLSWVKIHGTMYKPGCIVASGHAEDIPEFSEVVELISDEHGVHYFVLRRLPPLSCLHCRQKYNFSLLCL